MDTSSTTQHWQQQTSLRGPNSDPGQYPRYATTELQQQHNDQYDYSYASSDVAYYSDQQPSPVSTVASSSSCPPSPHYATASFVTDQSELAQRASPAAPFGSDHGYMQTHPDSHYFSHPRESSSKLEPQSELSHRASPAGSYSSDQGDVPIQHYFPFDNLPAFKLEPQSELTPRAVNRNKAPLKPLTPVVRAKRRLDANARERKRMTGLNEAFVRLRAVLGCDRDRPLSKMEALQMAQSRIEELKEMLLLC
jgi:hypothetical protein